MSNNIPSSFQSHFLFNVCMNQPVHQNKIQHIHSKNTLNNIKKIHPSKTLAKPFSMQDLQLHKKQIFTKKTQLSSPFHQILKHNPGPKPLNPSLANSFHVAQNSALHSDNLVQSQHSRKSRYEGNKIKIFSNDKSNGNIRVHQEKGKSISRESHGTSGSREKRGIQMTKNLLKKISGMYSTEDFNKSSQPTSNRTSLYHKNTQKHEKDFFHNQTGFLMTTWDSQQTTQEYQLSREYESINKNTRENFGLVNYGTMNVLNNSYESNRVTKELPRKQFNYSRMNDIADYSMGHDGQGSLMGNNAKTQIGFSTFDSGKKINKPVIVKEQRVPLPLEYQQNYSRPSYHLAVRPSQSGHKKLNSSISKGKLMNKTSQQKIFSSSNHPSPQKNSLLFSKSKQFQRMKTNLPNKHILFQTAHQILSQQVSSIKQPFHHSQSKREISGEELTNLLYGNKDVNFKKGESTMDEKEKEKYLVKYKNKTLDDLSVKQSMIEGYDNYYQ